MSAAPSASDGLLRDRPETAFSRILSAFLGGHQAVRAAVFLDAEGECVDYASRVDPYEAMVFSATLLNPTKALAEAYAGTSAGVPVQWVLEAERLDALMRRVSDDLFLAVWLEPGGLSARVLSGIEPLIALLSRESGLSGPGAEREELQVETRNAKGWGYAPQAVRGRGIPAADLEVLGRWTEASATGEPESVCFRVRTAEQEWTLVHDPAQRRWYRR